MEIIVDNKIVKLLASEPTKLRNDSLLFEAGNCLSFRWPSLLEYLGFGSLFLQLPTFGPGEALFEACVVTLCENENPEVVYHLFDRLFAENLRQIQSLTCINASLILETIKKEREKISSVEIKKLLFPTLAFYETAFTQNASLTLHDLILYLGWDRMCVAMARLFDYQSADPKFMSGLAILRECLMGSFQHITQHGRTKPGIYRMLESLLFYEMREENVGNLTASEWTTLSESFQILKPEDALMDCFYIDDAVALSHVLEENAYYYQTLDSQAQVNAKISLAQYMLNKIKSEVSSWEYVLQPKKIGILNEA